MFIANVFYWNMCLAEKYKSLVSFWWTLSPKPHPSRAKRSTPRRVAQILQLETSRLVRLSRLPERFLLCKSEGLGPFRLFKQTTRCSKFFKCVCVCPSSQVIHAAKPWKKSEEKRGESRRKALVDFRVALWQSLSTADKTHRHSFLKCPLSQSWHQFFHKKRLSEKKSHVERMRQGEGRKGHGKKEGEGRVSKPAPIGFKLFLAAAALVKSAERGLCWCW